MRPFRNASISNKLTMLTVLAVSVPLGVCVTVFVFNDVHTLKEAKRQELDALAAVLGKNAISAIEFDDRQAATDTLASLAKLPDIESAVLFDSRGEAFATYPADLPTVDQTSPNPNHMQVVRTITHQPGEQTLPTSTDLDELMHLMEQDDESASVSSVTDPALQNEPGCVGKIVIRASTDDIDKEMAAQTILAALLLIGSLAIGMGISWGLRRSITTPVNDLVMAARHVAECQDDEYHVHKHGQNELGVLSDAFNSMLEQLQAGRRQLQEAHDDLEKRVRERTEELEQTNQELEQEAAKRAALQEELVVTSRHAGMAEIATGVLHNVGNVLNSVNVSANLIMEQMQASRVTSLVKAAEMISQRQNDLAHFLTADHQGQHFPRLLEQLAANLSAQRDSQLEELRLLLKNIEHIREIVTMQQTYAHVRGVKEPVDLSELIEDALRLNNAGLTRHGVEVLRQISGAPTVMTEKHKVLQILINLISNAKRALCESGREDKKMHLVVAADESSVKIQVRDNGVGIPRENLTKIFNHGFTTRHEGHGFGLHSSALAAHQLGGSLSAHSDGRGKGAVFTLRLPVDKEALCTA